jgi:lipoprotein-anchoring transpeptidase ErfK/SrfK
MTWPGKWPLAGAAVAVCLGAAAIVLIADGSGDPGPAPPAPAEEIAVHAEGEPPKPRPTLDVEAPPGAYPVLWVRKGEEVEVRTEPGGGELVERAGKRTEYGSPTVFGVLRREGRWAAISTPRLANERPGWVRLDPRRMRDGWVRTSIIVDVSTRRAVLRKGDRAVRAFTVTVGAPGQETPTGRYAVTDTFRGNLNPAYGCCAVALSANQAHLPSGWLGGSRIAIHGTSGPLGVAASNGCVRAADEDVSALVDKAHLGTPVFIRG